MASKLVKCLVIFCTSALTVRSEFFTSTEDLIDVFIFEEKIVDLLTSAIGTTKSIEAQTQIEKYLSDYERLKDEREVFGDLEDKENDSEVERLAENPIHVYHLLKRLTTNRNLIKNYTTNEFWTRGLEDGVFVNKIRFPSDEDVEGAAMALIRLQSVYKVNISELASGNILGIQSAAVLRAQDCYDLGKKTFVMGLFFNAIEWLKESYIRAGSEERSSVSQDLVIRILKKAVSSYHDENPAETPSRKIIGGISIPEGEPKDYHKQYNVGKNISMEELFENYEALCRGELLMSEGRKSELKCFYDRRNSSYLILMPTKTEVHHLDPEILVFHDILSSDEILHLKVLAKPKLSRGIIQGMPDQDGAPSVSRISKVAWIDSFDDSLLASIEKRIETLTGLRTDLQSGSSELLQVANYGTGGHYNLHYDFLFAEDEAFKRKFHPRELELGDRIATFMFYASNVTRGGATVFPKLGVSIWPIKGSAAFWYNLKKSGRGDEMTLHGACPVVHGSKWIANKWIRENGQIMERNCDLSPDL